MQMSSCKQRKLQVGLWVLGVLANKTHSQDTRSDPVNSTATS